MFKAKTLEDFKELRRVIEEINKEDIYKLRLEIEQEFSECDLYVCDSTEELYYGGFLFERTLEELEKALQKDTGDSGAYFDCECPGRWVADFEGRSRYDEKDMEIDIHIAISKAMLKYMEDNGLEPHWTDELKYMFERLPIEIVDLILKVLDSTK